MLAILATGTSTEGPQLPGYQVVSFFLLKTWLFRQTIRFYLYRQNIKRLTEYFSVERNLTILALILFGLDVYLLNLKFYLNLLPFSSQLPSLVNISGIGVFFIYLVLLWSQLKQAYGEVIGVKKNLLNHIKDKMRIYLALFLPWLFINGLHDSLLLVPNTTVYNFMTSTWGEPLLLLTMILLSLIWFPALLVRLFGCTPMPDGPSRQYIEKSCQQQGVQFREICLWPIIEGKVLTAGVVGLFNRHCYLLITPDLLATLNDEELEAVVAHEIGHIKKFHLLLYLLIFIGFGVLIQLCMQPLLSLLVSTELFYDFLFSYEGDPELLLIALASITLVTTTLIYFRYVFGFFMRNFERQADIYSSEVMGSSTPLINVFKKIAMMNGNNRNMPCWYHFSIGQRIDYLVSYQQDQKGPQPHNLKVYSCLAAYFVAISITLITTLQLDNHLIDPYIGQQMAEDVILEKIALDPGNSLWHQFHGDLLVGRKQYQEAINAFELSLQLYPENAEALNNLAWLLLTADNRNLLDPGRALDLAKKAVQIQARSHILDTLAEAYWQNNMADMAFVTAQQALDKSSGNREYYQAQLKKFGSKS